MGWRGACCWGDSDNDISIIRNINLVPTSSGLCVGQLLQLQTFAHRFPQKCDLHQLEVWNRHFVRQEAASEIVQHVIDHLTLLDS